MPTKYNHKQGNRHRCIGWYTVLMLSMLSIGTGMILMYWITSWGAHGYECSSEGSASVCRKETNAKPGTNQ